MDLKEFASLQIFGVAKDITSPIGLVRAFSESFHKLPGCSI